jgi:hypothetical protein
MSFSISGMSTRHRTRWQTVHVRFDWTVHADRVLLRSLTPIVRPLFRWNHDQAIKQAMKRLEPYARDRAKEREATSQSG